MTTTKRAPARTAVETWLPVPGFPGYEVSDQGRVRSWLGRFRTAPLVLSTPRRNAGLGYRCVSLYRGGRPWPVRVYRLVTLAFLGPKPAGMVVRHLDGDATHDVLDNLRYGTPLENSADQRAHGTHSNTRKTHCVRGHAFDSENTYRSTSGKRRCRTCEQARKAKRVRRVAA